MKKFLLLCAIIGWSIAVKSQSITQPSVSPSSVCWNDSLTVSFTISGFAGSIDTFYLYISASGFNTADSVRLDTFTQSVVSKKYRIFNTYTAGANYKVKVYAENGTDSSLRSAAFTINAKPSTTITPSGATTFCTGSSVNLNATSDVNYAYQWRKNFANIGSATNSSYQANSSGSYKVFITNTVTGCSDSSSAVTISVNDITGGTIGSDQTLCAGATSSPLTNVSAATGAGTITYYWQSGSGTCGTASFSNISSATSATYSPGIVNVTTSYRRIAVSTLNGIPCETASNCITITANDITAGSIGSDQTICSGGTPNPFTVITAATGSGTLTYQWQSGTGTCGTASFTNIPSGGNSATYSPGALSTTTSYRRNAISTLNGVPCTATSNCITVTVNSIAAGAIASDQTICSGATPSAFTTASAASGSGTLTYQWQSGTGTCGTASFTDIASGGTGATYAPGALTTTTSYRRKVTSTLNTVQCQAISNCITITVNDVTAGSIGSDQTILANTTPATLSVVTAATGTGTLTYQWQSGAGTCGTASFTNISSGGTSATYSPGSLSTTTSYRRVAISTLNGVPCSATSNCITITINDVSSGTIASNQTICSGATPAPFTVVTAASGAGTLTYQWQSGSGTCATATFTDILSGGNAATYNPGPLTVTTSFRRKVTSTLNGVPSNATSNCISVTVNDVTAGAISSNQAICSGTTPNQLTVLTGATGSGTLTYQWQSGTGNCGTASFSDITTNGTSANYAPPSLTTTTSYRRIAKSTLNGVECTATSNCVTVTVNPKPLVGFTINNNTQCITNNSFTFSNNSNIATGTITYLWNFGNGSTSFATSPTFTYIASGVYTVKLVVTSDQGCKDSTTQIVTIYPVPTPSLSLTPSPICLGSNTLLSISIGNVIANVTTYAIGTFSGGSNIVATTTITTPNTFTTTTSVTPPLGSTTYFLTVTTSPCASASTTATVSVDSTTVGGTLSSGSVVCPNSTNTTIFTLSNKVGSVLKWQYSINDGTTWNDTAVTSTAITAKDIKVSTIYRAVIKSGVCATVNSPTAGVFVNTNPFASFSNNTVCENLPPTNFSNSSVDGTTIPFGKRSLYNITGTVNTITTYSWNFNDPNSGALNVSTATNPTHSFTQAGTYNVTLVATTNTVIGASTVSSCTNTRILSVIVLPKPLPPVLSSSNPTNVCLNQQGVNFRIDSVAGIKYQWSCVSPGVVFHGRFSPASLIDFPSTGGPFNIFVTAINAAGCRDSSKIVLSPTAVITINPSVILTNNSKTLVCLDNKQISYQWGFDSKTTFLSTDVPNATLQDFTPVGGLNFAANNYYVKLNSGGCTYKLYYNQPSAIGGSESNYKISLQPNPNKGNFNILITQVDDNSFALIYDVLGNQVWKQEVRSGQNNIHAEMLGNGIYFLQLVNSRVSYPSHKFIISK